MKAKLVIVSPEVTPNEFELKLPTKIGRGHDAKLKLVHPLISRLHCELFQDGEQLKIRDLDSLNGTFVNQERITEDTSLQSGATLMIGSVMARIQIGDDADRLPPLATATKTVSSVETVRKQKPGAEAAVDPATWEEPATGDSSEGLLDLELDDEPAPQPKQAAAADQQTTQVVLPGGAAPGAKKDPPTVPVPPAPAKPAAPTPAADDDEFNLMMDDAAEHGSEGEDFDDFFKSIM